MAKETLVQWNSRRAQVLKELELQRKIAGASRILKSSAEASLDNVSRRKNAHPAEIKRLKKNIKDAGKQISNAEKAIVNLVKLVDKINKSKPKAV
jgi:ElaB/YqjD/DUF883 family membrane-anchored ribosome-binding protein